VSGSASSLSLCINTITKAFELTIKPVNECMGTGLNDAWPSIHSMNGAVVGAPVLCCALPHVPASYIQVYISSD